MTTTPDSLLPILLRSPVHVDVFGFCLRNPGLRARVEHFARSLGRNLSDVEEAIDDLEREGWLKRHVQPAGDSVEFLLPLDAGSDASDRLEPYLALLRSASRSGK
jgi:DNA-binding MarR family transcriptional regulator